MTEELQRRALADWANSLSDEQLLAAQAILVSRFERVRRILNKSEEREVQLSLF